MDERLNHKGTYAHITLGCHVRGASTQGRILRHIAQAPARHFDALWIAVHGSYLDIYNFLARRRSESGQRAERE